MIRRLFRALGAELTIALVFALLLFLALAERAPADELRQHPGKVVVVPIDEADARVVVLDDGGWLVCWRVVEGPQAFQCRAMAAFGLPCDFDGGRFRCNLNPAPENPDAIRPPRSRRPEIGA